MQGAEGRTPQKPKKKSLLELRQARSKLFTQTDADKMIHPTSPFQGLLKKSLESVGSNGAGGNEPETHPFVSTDNLTTKHRMQVAKVAVGPWNTSMGERPQIRQKGFRVSMDILKVQQQKCGSG